ncbi:type II secretion system F family protein [Streptomyces sp. WMMC500]|uniref:type II secretion system F family protein n=1 Tax=Streptomyces sp. WMMC500 TaxID=3015154 RepID=UPI00248BDA7B|nr:type II secretion system F family protein [Streptomyces sp. WMMC500]WBB58270.1 type II secretion system F family protein [Streptomyces sp. WMMC500]
MRMRAEFIHSLWTALSVLAAAYCAADAALASWRARASRRRFPAVLGPVAPAARPGSPGRSGGGPRPAVMRLRETAVRWVPGLLAGVAVLIFVGGAVGAVAGLAAAYGIRRWQRRAATLARRDAGIRAGPDLALAADLLAACLAAGAGPRDAAAEVGRSLGGPVGERLARGAAELRLGAAPHAAWAPLAELPGAARLAGWLEQAGHTGVPVVDAVSRLAAECRAEETRAAAARARRAGVKVAGPLGLCFLPAFLAVGVSPVVMGLATRLLGGSA